MPDNWGYVFSAYGLAAVALLGYWRRLAGRAKRLARPAIRALLKQAGLRKAGGDG